MLKIYLVRHGQNKDNADGILNGHRDEPFTDIGIAQAHEIANTLKRSTIHFDVVYASPLIRATHTASIITDTLGLPKPEIMPDLIERDFGVMTGQLQSRIVELCAPDILQTDTMTYFLSPEGAETFPQLIERGRNIVSELSKKHTDENILLVTHGDLGKMVYASYYNLEWQEVLSQFHFGNSDMLELSPESQPGSAHMHKSTQYNL